MSFLVRELSIRISHTVMGLKALPKPMRETQSFEELFETYALSMMDLHPFFSLLNAPENENITILKRFRQSLARLHERHKGFVIQISSALLEWKEKDSDAVDLFQSELNRCLDFIFMSRIGTRVLVSHHLTLHSDPSDDPHGEFYSNNIQSTSKWAGIIDVECWPSRIIADAVEDACDLARRSLGDSPDVHIVMNAECEATKFPYIPTHLYYIVFELVKNTLRATIETHRNAERLPPVRIVIAKGDSDLTIKISDEGE
jgi:pyruvate dehydrogenase kinase 2/3/4